MPELFVVIAFVIGVIVGVRWSYHDMEVAEKKWEKYNRG